jgi:hypothetical protein
MCHFIISNDVYTDCLLWEKPPDPASDSEAEEEPPNKSQIAKLFRILHLKIIAGDESALVVENGSGGSGISSSAEKLAVHVIKQRTFFQCPTARANPDLFDKHADKRICENAAKITMTRPRSKQYHSTTGEGVPCPACEAAQQAIKSHLNRSDVVSGPFCSTIYFVYLIRFTEACSDKGSYSTGISYRSSPNSSSSRWTCPRGAPQEKCSSHSSQLALTATDECRTVILIIFVDVDGIGMKGYQECQGRTSLGRRLANDVVVAANMGK